MLGNHSMQTSGNTSVHSLYLYGLRTAAIAASFAVLAFASPANAQLAFDQSGGSAHTPGGTGTLGYQFDVLQAVTVTELDAYVGEGFLDNSTSVGIWNSTGTLLTSAIISITSPTITRPSANGGEYDGASIAGITLSVGTYTIGETINNANDSAGVFGTLIEDPRVSYGGYALYSLDSSLGEPTIDLVSGVVLGPSFEIGSAATPEPGSFALLVGMATLGVGVLRKRRSGARLGLPKGTEGPN